MSLVVSVSTNNVNRNDLSKWLDLNTAKNVQCVISNIFLTTINTYLKYKYLFNVPLRIWNCLKAFDEKEYWKIAFDVAALVTLSSPFGLSATIVIDCSSEIVNIYSKIKKNPTMEREEALRILGISEAEAQNQIALDKRFNELQKEWSKRIEKTKASPILTEKFKRLHKQTESAYSTLKKT